VQVPFVKSKGSPQRHKGHKEDNKPKNSGYGAADFSFLLSAVFFVPFVPLW
jgi:hypothetical protein